MTDTPELRAAQDFLDDLRPLLPCRAEHCTRKVREGIAYCCGPCADSWEATPRYEPHAHTALCELRLAERCTS